MPSFNLFLFKKVVIGSRKMIRIHQYVSRLPLQGRIKNEYKETDELFDSVGMNNVLYFRGHSLKKSHVSAIT